MDSVQVKINKSDITINRRGWSALSVDADGISRRASNTVSPHPSVHLESTEPQGEHQMARCHSLPKGLDLWKVHSCEATGEQQAVAVPESPGPRQILGKSRTAPCRSAELARHQARTRGSSSEGCCLFSCWHP